MTNSAGRPPSDPAPDDGLRRLLTVTFIVLGVVLIVTAIVVPLVVRWFGAP